MKIPRLLLAAVMLTGFSNVGKTQGAAGASLFDGKTLDGWIDQENSASEFGGGDIKDVSGVAKKLVAKSDPVSAFVNEKLGETNIALLVDYLASPSYSVTWAAEASTNSTAKKPKALPTKEKVASSMLAKNLNKIISGGALYEQGRFQDIPLRTQTTELLEKKPQGYSLERLNKLLLEDAYPAELAPGRPVGWIVKDGVLASTGVGRGTLYTAQDYGHYRLLLTMRHISGKPDHPAAILFFCRRQKDGEKPLDALGGIQFMIPQGYHWDYRPGHNGAGGAEFTTLMKGKASPSEWSRVEILVDAAKGTARLAVAQPPGAQAVELTQFKDPAAGRIGPIALQMHNGGLFDEYKDITVEVDPKVDDLITVK